MSEDRVWVHQKARNWGDKCQKAGSPKHGNMNFHISSLRSLADLLTMHEQERLQEILQEAKIEKHELLNEATTAGHHKGVRMWNLKYTMLEGSPLKLKRAHTLT